LTTFCASSRGKTHKASVIHLEFGDSSELTRSKKL